jgi:hypothetical protein
MRFKILGLIATTALLAALVVPGLVSAAGVIMEAKLKGSEEPAGGDPNGKGTAEVLAKKKKEIVAFELTYRNIEEASAAHIHKGKKGVDGPIVVPLVEERFPSGESGRVRNVDSDLIRKITRRPQNFYVNIHNAEYPGGAIRGQLSLLGD